MLVIRRSGDRGHNNHGWLDSYHTFSFNTYYDPEHMNFRSLRVINEDWIAPSRGFGAHPHRDMEILTYVLEGSLAHKDSMGHQETLGPNEIQRMSAGAGVVHSEFNASETEPVHLLQIWIEPATKGTPSSYEQFKFESGEKAGKWRLLASPEGGTGIARLNQDARLSVTELSGKESVSHRLGQDCHAWIQVIRGSVTVNGETLTAGDAAAISKEPELRVINSDPGSSEVLLFDLA